MESADKSMAPLANLSVVAPSLDSSPAKSPTSHILITVPDDKTEVRFETASLLSSSSTTEAPAKPKIPDGGWGWMVVFASLIISMIADGISFSFGLLYVEFLYEFGESKSVTSWIGSLFFAVPLLTGPVMSAFVDKYGCRSMTIVGGLISALGFIISSHVKTIGVMYVTFGLLAGLGLGLCYVTAVVSIAFWFDKKRTLAVGLGAAGTGIGTFVYSPLTALLLQEFGWRGTTLLLGGSFLNMCVCGALMRDPQWIIEQNAKPAKSSKSSKSSLVSLSSTFTAAAVDINEIKALLTSGKDAEYLLQSLETSTNDRHRFRSVLNLPTFIRQNEKVPFEVLEQLSANRRLYNIIVENYPSLMLSRGASERELNKLPPEKAPVTVSLKLKKADKPKSPPPRPVHQHSLPEDARAVQEPLLDSSKVPSPKRNTSFPWLKKQFPVVNAHQNYFKNITFHRHSLVHRGGAAFSTNKYRLRASSCPNIYRVSMTSIPKGQQKWYSEMLAMVKGMFDFSLFLELHFFLMSLSTIILFVWFIVPYMYLAEHMLRFSYTSNHTSFTLSNIGVTNTIGMVGLGWAGDQPWMNITKTYAVCLVLCGFSCAGMMFFTTNYIMLEVSAAFFGVFLSSCFSFTPGILVELVPLDRFTVAYGLQLLCMGIGNLLGPPFAGYLFDITGSWEQSFYQAAFWIIISGLLIAIIPFTKNRKMIGSGPVEKDQANDE